MNNTECIEELLNALMTIYSILSIEHYMILLLIIKSRSTDEVYDQLLNTVRDHLDKEGRILNNIQKLRNCLNEDATTLINDFTKNVQEGTTLVNDPEFISTYINNPREAVKSLTKYVLTHEELLSKIINTIRQHIRNHINNTQPTQ